MVRTARTYIRGRALGATAALLLALLSSCVSDELAVADGNAADSDTATVKIQFTLNIMGDEATTRATTWGDNYDEATANNFENHIDNLHVFVRPTTGSNGKTCSVENLTNVGGTTVTGSFELDETLLNSDGTFSGWIVAVANYENADELTASEITSLEYFMSKCSFGISSSRNEGSGTATYNDISDINKGTKYIPMWGFKRYTTSNSLAITKGGYTEIGDIYMLRSVAKVKVSLSEDAKKMYKLTGAKAVKIAQSGYVAPNVSNLDNASSLSELEIEEKTIHTYSDADKTDQFTLTDEIDFNFNEEDGAYYFYMPEVENKNMGIASFKLTYQDIDDNDGTTAVTKEIPIDTYEDGKATNNGIDIIRNTVYDYTVSISPVGVDVSLETMPWSVTESSIGWNVQSDTTAGIDPVLYAWEQKKTTVTTTETDSNGDNVEKVYYNYPVPADATEGDAEAKYCYVSYPRYAGSNNQWLQNMRSGADFYFLITAPEGAVWQAQLTNTEDFEFDTKTTWKCKYWDGSDSEEKKLCQVATGIARKNDEYEAGKLSTISTDKAVVYCRPYKITVKPKKPWYKFTETSKSGTRTETVDDKEKTYENCYEYSSDIIELTEAGGKWEEEYGVTGGPYTDLYITVSLNGVDEELLKINPTTTLKVSTEGTDGKTYYSDQRRFAIGDRTEDKDYYIRIWQLKATDKKNDSMVKANTANKTYYANSSSSSTSGN